MRPWRICRKSQGDFGLPPNVLNTTAVISTTENRYAYKQADLTSSGATNYPVLGGHGDGGNIYVDGIGVIYQPAYQNFFANAGYPIPLAPPVVVTGPLFITQETGTLLVLLKMHLLPRLAR